MMQDLKNNLLDITGDHSKTEGLTKLLYQLGTTGWPKLNDITQELLHSELLYGDSTGSKHTSQLNRTLRYLSTLEPKMSSYKSPHQRAQAETERLAEQLKAMLTKLELHLTLEAKDQLSTLSDMLWLGAAQWLLKRVDEAQDQALLELLAELSFTLSELNPKVFFSEAPKMISAHLKGCDVGYGALEVVSYDELLSGGIFADIRAVSSLTVSTAGALSALLHRVEAGERFVCALELRDELKIGERCFRLLIKSELLGAVYDALKDRKLQHELSDTTLTALLGDELTAAHIGDDAVMRARVIAERVEVLQLSMLNPMVLCPAGEFWMGSEEGVGDEDEHPRHRVKISKPFLMGQTQVTQALWKAVMGDTPSEFHGSDLPMEQLNWFDMVRFCNRLSELESFKPAYDISSGDKPHVSLDLSANGYRLPTEAEWEYAAKAGTELVYAGSAKVDEVAWYDVTTNEQGTRPVATKKPNAWGLYDMSGNVWEWCHDQWDEEVYVSRPDMSSDPCHDDSACEWRVLRGGSWLFDDGYCRVSLRFWSDADFREGNLGGRLLRCNIDR